MGKSEASRLLLDGRRPRTGVELIPPRPTEVHYTIRYPVLWSRGSPFWLELVPDIKGGCGSDSKSSSSSKEKNFYIFLEQSCNQTSKVKHSYLSVNKTSPGKVEIEICQNFFLQPKMVWLTTELLSYCTVELASWLPGAGSKRSRSITLLTPQPNSHGV